MSPAWLSGVRLCGRFAKYISGLILLGWAQGADWIQTPAVDTDQQKQLSEKLPSASLPPHPSVSTSPTHSIHLHH